MQTSAPAVFACGNVVHVNDLVDNVSGESETAGRAAARYAMGTLPAAEKVLECRPGKNVRYLCPQRIALNGEAADVTLYFRVLSPEDGVFVTASCEGDQLCRRGAARVNPGEMQHVTVNTGKLAQGALTVDVEKRG